MSTGRLVETRKIRDQGLAHAKGSTSRKELEPRRGSAVEHLFNMGEAVGLRVLYPPPRKKAKLSESLLVVKQGRKSTEKIGSAGVSWKLKVNSALS